MIPIIVARVALVGVGFIAGTTVGQRFLSKIPDSIQYGVEIDIGLRPKVRVFVRGRPKSETSAEDPEDS